MKRENNSRFEIVERYCPKCGENVIMRRFLGVKNKLMCVNYDSCVHQKDKFCGDNKNVKAGG